MIYSIAHHSHKLPVRIQVNGKNITRSTVARIQNRSFFVSHAIIGMRSLTTTALAYKMFRLKGSVAEMAAMIRQQMCHSKIALLEEVLKYPASPYYLGQGSSYFDYATPIRTAIRTISSYPEAFNK